jgi:hypothetical protein
MATLDFTVLYHDRGADKGLKNLGKTTEKTGHSFKAMKVAGVAAIAAVAVGVAKFGKDSVKAYVEAEQSQVRLQEAFRKFPKLADTNIGSLNKLNSALALKTKFDDDATASGQAVLAQFNLTGKQITQLTPLLQDYAAKTGKDLPAAASVMGKAFMGNTKALKAIGINYKATGNAGKDFENIQRLVNEKVGGFAEKEGKSAAGQAAILKNQFGELQESAGQQLLPALLKVGNGLLKFVGYIGTLSPLFSSFKRIVVATFGSFAESIGAGELSFKNFADYIDTHQADIVSGFIKAGKAALGLGSGLATAASVGLRAFATILEGQTNLTAASLASFGKMLQGASLAFGWIPGIGPKLKGASASFDRFAGTAVNGMRDAADGARAAADGIDAKLKPALDKAGRSLDAVGKKEIVKARTRDAVAKAAIAVQDLGTKSDGSQIKLKKFSDRTKLSATEAKGLHTRLSGVRGALRDQLGAMRDAGAGQAKLSEAWKTGKRRLYEEFRQMGLSKDEARKLAKQYAGIPPKVKTTVTQPGMKSARDNTKDLDTLINRLNDKNVMISYSTNAEKLALQWRKNQHDTVSPKRARGGPVPGNSPTDSADDVNVALTSGEWVIRRSAARKYGSAAMNAVNEGRARIGYAAGGEVHRNITTTVEGRRSFPNFNGIGNSLASRIGNQLGAGIQKELKRLKAAADAARDAADDLSPGGKKMSGSIVAIARRFNPSYIAPHRDPRGQPSYDIGSSGAKNNAIANALRANHARLGLQYVISQMRITSAKSAWNWRRYSPITGSGDFRHVNHVHVTYDKGGIIRPGLNLVRNGTRQPERVLTSTQNQAYERLVRVAERSNGAGQTVNINVSFPNYVGDKADLKRALVDLNRGGHLDVIKRVA